MKVYIKGGLTDKVQVDADASVGHSRTDLNGRIHDDFVSIVVTDNEGHERQYLISQIDSLVMPNGRRVVFVGDVNGNENDNENQNENEKSSRSPQRRTSFEGEFPGTVGKNVKFYWTENDRIRLDVGNVSRARLTGDGSSAAFVFDDAELDALQYTVYYPDKTVTIATQQTQTGVDNTQHIGRSGDCGIGTARRDGNANVNENSPSPTTDHPTPITYSFTLDHQVAYLCFLPRIDYLPSVRVTQIDVECSAAIAGTYELSAWGLEHETNTSKAITLTLDDVSPSGDFFIGHTTAESQRLTASYMVIAPQSSSRTFTVTYHLVDTLSRFTTTYQQTFELKPLPNTVYPVTCHIPESLFRAVDLGYDYLWSSVNLGSERPNEAGDYHTWEVGQSALSDGWQIPAEDAANELLNKCTWTWGTFNGIDGWFVEGTNHDNVEIGVPRIFLPLNGYKNGGSLQNASNGYYWLDTQVEGAATQEVLMLTNVAREKALMNASLAMNARPAKAVPREFRIPYRDIDSVDLRTHGPGYSIKVYDHAGPEANYDNDADGCLLITCAEGYKLNVTGNVSTEEYDSACDPFEVYDGPTKSAKRIAQVWRPNKTVNVTSSSNVILLRFASDSGKQEAGVDVTVTIQKSYAEYELAIANVEGGTMTASVAKANPEDTVTLTAHPASGYYLDHIRVDCVDGRVLTLYEDDPMLKLSPSFANRHYLMNDTVQVRDGNWYHDVSTFLMPYGDVTITPVFVREQTADYVWMAAHDTTYVRREFIQRLLDSGTDTFRFCDSEGPAPGVLYDSWRNHVSGSMQSRSSYMLIDAPVGYVLQIDGKISSERNYDFLRVYDGTNRNNPLLLEESGPGDENS